MEKFTLTVFFTLSGLGAASGLVYQKNSLYIIADNASFLYQYKIKSKQLTQHKLIENAQNNTPKKEKLDLEAITKKGDELHIFGSGSKKNRSQKFVFNTKTQIVQSIDQSELYKKIVKETSISSSELNLEGALYFNQNLIVFQRGNGEKSQNGVIKITPKQKINYTPINLPKIKNVATTFTDAILVQDKIYFLASAEASNSTYNDGEVLGSIFGVLNAKTFQVEKTILVSTTQKFEGITFYKKTKHSIQFLLCQDNDTNHLESVIYLLEV